MCWDIEKTQNGGNITRIIDLTHEMAEGMPVYPGTEPPIFRNVATLERDGFSEKKLAFTSHTGTHMDAPAHILPDGATLDALPVDQFMGSAVVVDLRRVGPVVELKDLKPYEERLRQSEYLVCHTGWASFWGQQGYTQGFPVLSPQACVWVASLGLKGVALDAISVDPVESLDLPNHKTILNAKMVIVENLTNLERLPRSVILWCLPLKIADADGAPVRAVALVEP
ncbi:MAG: hydrolase [Dethiosulfovibrio peptidovorans]|nr:MAG: hydrolase [Dethiosulfovibrio peptidovorans]